MRKAQRDKGRRGQAEFGNLIRSRDWDVVDTSSGMACEDMVAKDADGVYWSIEVKNTVAITTAHRAQAIAQGNKRKLPWLLASKIAGTSAWLIQRKGEKPVVWSEA